MKTTLSKHADHWNSGPGLTSVQNVERLEGTFYLSNINSSGNNLSLIKGGQADEEKR